MSDASSIGPVIRARRREIGMTQEELGRTAGYESGAGVSISRVEHGHVVPGVARLDRIAGALGLTVDELSTRAGVTLDELGAPTRSADKWKSRLRAVEDALVQREATMARLSEAGGAAEEAALGGVVTPLILLVDAMPGVPDRFGGSFTGETRDAYASTRMARSASLLSAPSVASPESSIARDVGLVGGATSHLHALGLAGGHRVLALVEQFGRASTGARIADLHGAARSNAGLAALGGGARRVNGFGMVGGRALLQGIAVLPAAIAFGGVFALAVMKDRSERQAKIAAGEQFLAVTDRRYEAIVQHYEDSNAILAVAQTHGAWAFETWIESLPSGAEQDIAWDNLSPSQQQGLDALWRLAAAIMQLAALDPEAMLEAPSDSLPSLADAARGGDERPCASPADEGEETFEEIELRYAEARRSANATIRTALGRAS